MKKTFKRNQLIYLANAYSSKLEDKDQAALQQSQRRMLESSVGGRLKKRYSVTLILPIAISASMADLCKFGTGFDSWEQDDYTFISVCDEVWVLVSDGWSESVGVLAEIAFAKKHQINVRYLNPVSLDLSHFPELIENEIIGG